MSDGWGSRNIRLVILSSEESVTNLNECSNRVNIASERRLRPEEVKVLGQRPSFFGRRDDRIDLEVVSITPEGH